MNTLASHFVVYAWCMRSVFVELLIIEVFFFSFSRKIIWLHLSPSNRDARTIARYYLLSIEKAAGAFFSPTPTTIILISELLLIGCPKVVRADLGTENASVAKIHIALRTNHSDSLAAAKSFIYGPSTANTVGCNAV